MIRQGRYVKVSPHQVHRRNADGSTRIDQHDGYKKVLVVQIYPEDGAVEVLLGKGAYDMVPYTRCTTILD